MKKNINPTTQAESQPRRRLSFFRVLLAMMILAGIGYGSFLTWNKWEDTKVTAGLKPWFAAYVDVTATPRYDFEQLGKTTASNVVLSFIVSSLSDSCTPTWGGNYTLDKASVDLDLDRRIARLKQQGGDIAISFGGLLNDELAVNCTDNERLINAYSSVLEKYEVDTMDLDIEGLALKNTDSITRRAVAISTLQEKRRLEGKSLAVWLTLPVTPQGLSVDGTNAVAQMLAKGVDLSGVNIMTMDYGQSKEKGQTMQEASQRALLETHRQLGILYDQAGITLNSASLWTKIGATPMIGQNDVAEEVFTLDDAKGLNAYAHDRGVIRMSMWSANRDVECGENYVNLSVVSDSCSGVKQEKLKYSALLSEGFEGDLRQNAAVVTQEDSETEIDETDIPENSPYQIWSARGVYLAGTKVVWHRNVYQAKWWTEGDLPDNPVLQSWQTPWQLVGPVLPGEKPIKQLTLPEGIYENWSGTEKYDAGDRVLFNGVPFQAKWWNQGDSPAASTSNPASSPWVALTQTQIEKILQKIEKDQSSNLN